MRKYLPIRIIDITKPKWGAPTPPTWEEFTIYAIIEYQDTYRREDITIKGRVVYHDFFQEPEIKVIKPINLHPQLKARVIKLVKEDLPEVRNSFPM